jgi:hypothetical protein
MKLPAIPVVYKKALSTFSCLYLTSSSVVENMKRGCRMGKRMLWNFSKRINAYPISARATMKKSWPRLYNNSRMEGKE